MILTTTPNIALLCDWEGHIQEVLCDEVGMGDGFASGQLFMNLVEEASKSKAFHFLTTLKIKGSAFDWELNVKSAKGFKSLYFAGGAIKKSLLIIAAPSRTDANKFYEEVMRTNNEQVNALRSAFKEQNLLKRSQKKQEHHYYEELTHLNNEMATMQRELAKKNAQLRQLNKQKNQFLGMAAHDLRNPLSGIMGFSEFLLQEPDLSSEEQQEFLQIIHQSSQFMLRLVNDLLSYSTVESGKLELRLEKTNLVAQIQRNVELNRVIAQQKGIQISFDHDQNLPAVLLDGPKIDQVLNNLISNAIKYSHPDTQIEVTLRQEDSQIVIAVQDQGQGIPADEVDKLFKPFQKTSVQSTAGEESTGLGLAIVKNIVQGHQGRIWVTSQVGKGSTFYISLPIHTQK
ncbi:MAG: sensor histidine kinase [Ardenticatenaceae bacterium]